MFQKKFLLIFFLVLAGSFLGWSGNSLANLNGSKHDFSGKIWNPEGSACKPCHIPHQPKAETMWGRQLSSTVYTMYPDTNLIGTVDAQPSVSSRLCLSCHDGTKPLNTKNGSFYIPRKAQLGTDLRKHKHPISISYVTSNRVLPPSSPSGLGRSIAKDLLKSDKVECVSCHDVHNRYGNKNMLIKRKEELCRTCHYD